MLPSTIPLTGQPHPNKHRVSHRNFTAPYGGMLALACSHKELTAEDRELLRQAREVNASSVTPAALAAMGENIRSIRVSFLMPAFLEVPTRFPHLEEFHVSGPQYYHGGKLAAFLAAHQTSLQWLRIGSPIRPHLPPVHGARALAGCTALKKLDLTIGGRDLRVISAGLPPNLHELQAHVLNGESDFLAEALRGNTSLQHLRLLSYIPSPIKISQMLARNTTLKTLLLLNSGSWNLHQLRLNAHLQGLELGLMNIPGGVLPRLIANLKMLGLNECEGDFTELFECLARNSTLTHLNLEQIPLGEVDFSGLARNTTLRTLRLESCDIEMASLARAGLGRVAKLNLTGAKGFSEAVVRDLTMTFLRHVNVAYCEIEDSPGAILVRRLPDELCSLNLAGNHGLAHATQTALQELLRRSTTLRGLAILSTGVRSIGSHMGSLRVLAVDGNHPWNVEELSPVEILGIAGTGASDAQIIRLAHGCRMLRIGKPERPQELLRGLRGATQLELLDISVSEPFEFNQADLEAVLRELPKLRVKVSGANLPFPQNEFHLEAVRVAAASE